MSTQQLNAMPNGKIDPIYLIIGTEDYLNQQVINNIKQQLGQEQESSELIFDLLDYPITSLLQEANEISFFSNHQLLIAKNPFFLTSERQKTDVEHNLEALINYLDNPNPETTIVFIANYDKLDERKKITKLLKKKATVIDYSKQTNNYQIIHDYLQKQDIVMDSDAIKELLYLVNDSLTMAINEIDKLHLYAGAQPITKEMLDELVPRQVEHVIFDLVDYLLKNKKQQALQMYQDLVTQGEDTIKINYIILMQLRLMIQIKILEKRHYTTHDIAEAVKVHPYRVKKTSALIYNLSIDQLMMLFDILVDFEEKLKSSAIDDYSFFQMIVARFNFK